MSALLVVGCGAAVDSVAQRTVGGAAASVSLTLSSNEPAVSGTPTDAAGSTEATTTDAPVETVTAATETPSVAHEPATDCTGTGENRTFYASVAAAVEWTVYCPVLPSGWFVEQGSYRLPAGGRLTITYRGPGGAHLTLSEGAWCTDGSGCTPAGANAGPAAFGDREGALVAGDGGRIAIVVDPGAPVSWQLTGDGLDEGTLRMVGAALIAVGG